MLHQIIYTSSSLPSATLEEFKGIARHAAQKNRVLDITGILLFSDGVIFQVLEGEKSAVETLYDIIQRDHRHSGVMKMISRSTAVREFPNWSMGFAEMDIEQVSEIAFLLTKDTLAKALPAAPSAELRVLSQTFAKINGL